MAEANFTVSAKAYVFMRIPPCKLRLARQLL